MQVDIFKTRKMVFRTAQVFSRVDRRLFDALFRTCVEQIGAVLLPMQKVDQFRDRTAQIVVQDSEKPRLDLVGFVEFIVERQFYPRSSHLQQWNGRRGVE